MKKTSPEKVTLVLTTKNEANSISRLLDSVAHQSRIPDEIVIVDSESTDNTRQIITESAKEKNLNLKLIKRNTNRSQARNLAVTKASNSIIAVTDAGCILDKNWLKNITKPLIEDKADSVAGYYLPVTPTCFEKSVAPFVAVMPGNLNPETFLPSSRSVAFTKSAWKKIGKYPEKLNYCEDLVFASRLKDNTRMVVETKAVAYWLQSTNFFSFFRQIQNYAQGDVEALYTPHLKKIVSVYLRYLIFFLFPPAFSLYLIWPILKHYKQINHPSCVLFLPPLQVTADVGIITGSFSGLIKKYQQFAHLKPTTSTT